MTRILWVMGASRHNIDVEMAAEVPEHGATLWVTPVVMGLAVGGGSSERRPCNMCCYL